MAFIAHSSSSSSSMVHMKKRKENLEVVVVVVVVMMTNDPSFLPFWKYHSFLSFFFPPHVDPPPILIWQQKR